MKRFYYMQPMASSHVCLGRRRSKIDYRFALEVSGLRANQGLQFKINSGLLNKLGKQSGFIVACLAVD